MTAPTRDDSAFDADERGETGGEERDAAAALQPDDDEYDDEHADEHDDAFAALLREVAYAPSTLGWTLRPGTRVNDRWRIVSELGRGGMGVVAKAVDETLNRDVALKLLHEGPGPDAHARLLAEARAAARVEHANVASVYDVGEDQSGRAFLAMELVAGETLRARFAREGALPIADVERVAANVSAALGAAHRAQIVHGDLKPENVMWTLQRQACVLDFGLATAVDDDERMLAGTLAYLAPECGRGAATSPQSDVFALGAVLFEALTGQRLFGGTTKEEVEASVAAYSPPPRSAFPRDCPKPVVDAICCCLALDPGARFVDGTAAEEAFSPAPQSAPPRFRPALAVAMAGALAGAVLLFAVPGLVSSGSVSSSSLENAPGANGTTAFALRSIPEISGTPAQQARFRVAVERWYAGDDLPAARALSSLLVESPDALAPLLLRLFVRQLELDELDGPKLRARILQAAAGKLSRLAAVARVVVALRFPADSDVSGAQGAALTLMAESPKSYFDNLMLTLALASSGLEGVQAQFQTVIAADPKPARPYLHLAWGQMRRRRALDASGTVETGLAQDPGNLALQGVAGQIALGAGRLEEAERIFDGILKRWPENLEVRFDRAEAAFLRGDEARWRSDIDRIVTGPFSPSHRGRGVAMHARLLWSRGRMADAAQLFAAASEVLLEAGLWSDLWALQRERVLWAWMSGERAERDRVQRELRALRANAKIPARIRAECDSLVLALDASALSSREPAVQERLSARPAASFSPPLTRTRVLALVQLTRLTATVDATAPPRKMSESTALSHAQVFEEDSGTSSLTPRFLDANSIWARSVLAPFADDERTALAALVQSAPECVRTTNFRDLWCRAVLAPAALRLARLDQSVPTVADTLFPSPDADLDFSRRRRAMKR